MNISNSMSVFNFPPVNGARAEKIYAWPNYGESSVGRVNPINNSGSGGYQYIPQVPVGAANSTDSDVLQNGIQVLLPQQEREEMIRSHIENFEAKNDFLYTPNGKNYAANFAIVGSLFDALV